MLVLKLYEADPGFRLFNKVRREEEVFIKLGKEAMWDSCRKKLERLILDIFSPFN